MFGVLVWDGMNGSEGKNARCGFVSRGLVERAVLKLVLFYVDVDIRIGIGIDTLTSFTWREIFIHFLYRSSRHNPKKKKKFE